MWRICAFFFLLLAGCASLPPADPSSEEMRGANVVTVRTDDSPDQAYTKILQMIGSKGYPIEHSDAAARMITTGYADAGRGEMQVMVVVQEDPTRVMLRSNLQVAAMNSGAIRVDNASGLGSPIRGAWRRLVELGESYLGGEVVYARD